MSWEWDSQATPHRWALTVGGWQASVRKTNDPRAQWQAAIEQLGAPHTHFAGPAYHDALGARRWCLAKIAELRRR